MLLLKLLMLLLMLLLVWPTGNGRLEPSPEVSTDDEQLE
jgi:hypothetical protein